MKIILFLLFNIIFFMIFSTPRSAAGVSDKGENSLPKINQPFNENMLLIDEPTLGALLERSPPNLTQINEMFMRSQVNQLSILDKFNTNLTTSASYLVTEEKQFAQFIPVTSPIKNVNLSVNRKFSNGLSLGVRGYSEQFSNNFVSDASTMGVTLNLGLDLWREFIGKKTTSLLEKAKEESHQAEHFKNISIARFKNSIRKIYWALVANAEELKVTNELLSSSIKQVKEAKKRYKNNIADRGEVARYQSQVSARKSSIISLKYERASIVKGLKELIPEISLKKIQLSPYDIDKTIALVLACTETIANNNLPPLENTFYDDIVASLEKQELLEEKVNNTYDDIDLKFQTEYGYKGRANSRGDSLSDLQDDPRVNYAVGLTLNIPLDKKKKTTAEVIKKATKLKYKSLRQKQMAKIKSFHSQTIRQINLLRNIIKNQADNTKYLAISLKTSKRKYNQARLTVEQLVQEQDSYLQSNLDEIRTKLAIINTIFDYLSVYTETPCKFNRIIK